ncbi:MAG: MotA/TolQ/ExbB proton channel family protein, partial [Gammaproteobacteria bacterium]
MLEIVQAGGWLMLPIIACSIAAAAIILERLWTLQHNRVLPSELAQQVTHWAGRRTISAEHLQRLHESSPLGQ